MKIFKRRLKLGHSDWGMLFSSYHLFLLLCLVNLAPGQIQKRLLEQRHPSVFKNYEVLDPEGKYELEYVVDWARKQIHFEVLVQTKGYIAFGLGARPRWDRADVVVGGVNPDGSPYFTDRHGVDNRTLPQLDASQDWKLLNALENGTHTYLSFSRDFQTCDNEDDHPVNKYDTVNIFWAYGVTDDPVQEWTANPRYRGTYFAHLLDPSIIPREMKKSTFVPGPTPQHLLDQLGLKLWNVHVRLKIQPKDTTYQCTIHKGPRLTKKHHIVGFYTRVETEDARTRSHHIILYRCKAPPPFTDKMLFGRHVGTQGQECYLPNRALGPIPTPLCAEALNGFAIGSGMVFYPDHVGQPIGFEPDEYYMYQVHYDNSQLRSDIEYDINFELYYTDQLRPNEMGLMYMGHSTPGTPSILIPPKSLRHETMAYCSPACTQKMFPKEPVNIFMTILHTHLSGRKIRLRHFRGEQELPWINADFNYESAFQDMRMLRTEAQVLPGDQIMAHCEHDSTNQNGTLLGGYATRQEMCLAFVFYYNRVEGYTLCSSQIVSPDYMRRYLGVTNTTWDVNTLEETATAPRHLANMTLLDISDNLVQWTPELRRQLQRDQKNLPQRSECLLNPLTAFQRGEIRIRDILRLDLSNYLRDQATGFIGYPYSATTYNEPLEETCAATPPELGTTDNLILPLPLRRGLGLGARAASRLAALTGPLVNLNRITSLIRPNIWTTPGFGIGLGLGGQDHDAIQYWENADAEHFGAYRRRK